jgi:transcriptional regulator with XRE-family HTH domain
MIFDHYDQVLARVITDSRTELGITRAQAAEIMDITEGRYTSWEFERARLPAADFMRLALNVFGIHPSELMQRVERELLGDADTNGYGRH